MALTVTHWHWYSSLSVSCVLQIHTSEQYATGLVFAYPYTPRHKQWQESLAAERGEPSIQELMENDAVSDMQHAANWERILGYLSSLTLEQKQRHVPLPC